MFNFIQPRITNAVLESINAKIQFARIKGQKGSEILRISLT